MRVLFFLLYIAGFTWSTDLGIVDLRGIYDHELKDIVKKSPVDMELQINEILTRQNIVRRFVTEKAFNDALKRIRTSREQNPSRYANSINHDVEILLNNVHARNFFVIDKETEKILLKSQYVSKVQRIESRMAVAHYNYDLVAAHGYASQGGSIAMEAWVKSIKSRKKLKEMIKHFNELEKLELPPEY
ncbi:hypothetical protein O9G_005060 [Rozella allomycis CSF55]|uniref:Uncharacterized protein n=1 Tax=Rozella allomycis (strain CSF55) TaxID=988480 RepID=A0A075ARF2_ROZAC|nr:hypothetical protein O9G_005060 [Rozella allomycis CSF55]|eukprot:EPZ32876.1 hypothetical protein O9G_005060 [Rozella allomycis CSF55]